MTKQRGLLLSLLHLIQHQQLVTTVDNTLGNMVNSKEIRRPKKGIYSLNPKDIQGLTLVPDTLSGSTIG